MNLLFVFLVLIAGKARADKPFIVGLYEGGLPPFSFDKESSDTGIYLDILEKVMKITGVEYKVEYFLYARINRTFNEGEIDIDPGNSPEWLKEESKKNSLFTIPFWNYDDALVVRKGKTIGDIKGKPLMLIRGYHYPGEMSAEKLGYIPFYTKNEKQQFKMFMAERYDFFIAGVVVSKYYSKIYNYPIKIARTFSSTPISYRIHISKKPLLERMNRALKKLTDDGTIDRIVKNYIK
ncbi:MAG: amino acid ABC transporter substrate-binding protein [Desulfobacteraceae bacterium]|nr:amino acid ABC transporter substrate-binding protein [Desulfobacteraceae bacterium]